MSNQICTDFSNPSLFSTDKSVSPVPTQISHLSTSSFQKRKQQLLSSNPQDEGENSEQQNKNSSSSTNLALASVVATSTIAGKQKRKSKNASLLIRFVQARLEHFKFHILKRIGCHVKDSELSQAEDLIFSVEDEICDLGELIDPQLSAVDESFTQMLSTVSQRVETEKTQSSAFTSTCWYGALCKQVDDNAELLVGHRKLQREKEGLERQVKALEENVVRAQSYSTEMNEKYHKEKQLEQQRTQMKQGFTAKLVTELNLKDAEKAGGAGGGSGENSDDNNQHKTQEQLEQAKSLRLQDEITVLKKAGSTLQVALSRVTHQYSVLLQEHENLKTEIRTVMSQQDAEEADIRRIFLEREREFDIALKHIQKLERELNVSHRRLDASSSRSTTSLQQQHPSFYESKESNSNASSAQSLSQRLKSLNKKSSNNLKTAYHETENTEEIPKSASEIAEQSRQQRKEKQQKVLQKQISEGGEEEEKKPSSPKTKKKPKKEQQQEIVGEEEKKQESPKKNLPEDEEHFEEEEEEEEDEVIKKFLQDHGDDEFGEDDDVSNKMDSYFSSPRLKGISVGTMTEKRDKKQFNTVGCQTFIRNAGVTTTTAPSIIVPSASIVQRLLNSRSAKNNNENNTSASESNENIINMKQTLEKFVRLMNRQQNVIERFLDENFTHNILRRREFLRMMKQFGIPTTTTSTSENSSSSAASATSSSSSISNNNNSWHGTLHRFPLSCTELEKDIEEWNEIVEERKKKKKKSFYDDEDNNENDKNNNIEVQTQFSGISEMELLFQKFQQYLDEQNEDDDDEQTRLLRNYFKSTTTSYSKTTPSKKSSSSYQPSIPSSINVSQTAFWNPESSINALRRLYVDAGRLIDTVENEAEQVSSYSQFSPSTLASTSPFSVSITKGASAAATSSMTPDPCLNASEERQQQQAAVASSNLLKSSLEKVATDQFFAIRSLESSCNMLVQRLSSAKEQYVKRFYDKSSLLNQTLGLVSKTHPREANKLSRLAKNVRDARVVMPWNNNNPSSSCNNMNIPPVINDNNNYYLNSVTSPFMTSSRKVQHDDPSSSATSPPIVVMKSSEIVMGKHMNMSTPPPTSTSTTPTSSRFHNTSSTPTLGKSLFSVKKLLPN